MRWIRTGAIAVTVLGGGVAARRALAARRTGSGSDTGAGGAGGPENESRWHVLTVNRPRDEVAPDGRLPGPLAELGDAVEVRLSPAPGGRGTEIAARPRDGAPSGVRAAASRLTGDDSRRAVRRALRESRQLLETGEILSPDQPSTTRPTLLNRPLRFATLHGKEEGLL
ncbi:MAG TPA: hypothetical protein VF755_25445 [Catenuloplanes sp.]|jgi:hypothetical protein